MSRWQNPKVNLSIAIIVLLIVGIILIIVNVTQNANKKEGEKKEYTFLISGVLLLALAALFVWLIFRERAGKKESFGGRLTYTAARGGR